MGLILVMFLGLRAYQGSLQSSVSEINTPVQGVHLIGGQVFYGKLDKTYTDFPVLYNVHVIQQKTDPVTQQVSSTLVKVPQDRIVLNRTHILLIEPVNPDTPLGKMIAQDATSSH